MYKLKSFHIFGLSNDVVDRCHLNMYITLLIYV